MHSTTIITANKNIIIFFPFNILLELLLLQCNQSERYKSSLSTLFHSFHKKSTEFLFPAAIIRSRITSNYGKTLRSFFRTTQQSVLFRHFTEKRHRKWRFASIASHVWVWICPHFQKFNRLKIWRKLFSKRSISRSQRKSWREYLMKLSWRTRTKYRITIFFTFFPLKR